MPKALLLLFFIIAPNIFAQKSLFEGQDSFESALNKSKKENKPIFLMVYAHWCSYCNQMKKEVFTQKEVIEFLDSNFIPVMIDGETENGKSLKEKFKIKSYPGFAFISGNEEILYKISGRFSAEELLYESGIALNPKMQLPYLEKEFNVNVNNPEICLAYITTLLKGKNRKELEIPTHQYLATQSETQLLSEMNWRIISNGVSDIESREFQFVLRNKEQFEAIASLIRVQRKIENMVTEFLKPDVERLDIASYLGKRGIIQAMQLPETDRLLFAYDLEIGSLAEDWGFYKKITVASTEKLVWNDAGKLKEISSHYLKNSTDKANLNQAIKWSKRSLELSNSYDGQLLLAKLHQKANNKKEALAEAERAKNFAAEMGWDAKEAANLILELNKKS